MPRLSSLLGLAIFFAAPTLFAQQPLCIPGTQWCLPNAANGQVNGGANGQVGPNGANGNANGNGNGQIQQPRPPPTYVPPPPPPTYPPPQPPRPQPPPYVPPPQPTPPPAPVYPQPTPHYGPSAPASIGLSPLPILRVGVDSGFHLGGVLDVTVRGERWGGGILFGALGGGTTGIFDLTFVPEVVLRTGDNTGCRNCFDGFYFVGGAEIRISIADRTNPIGSPDIYGLGLQIGAGYDLPVNASISWRILDVRAFGAWRPDHLSPRYDDFDHHFEVGAIFLTGFDFVSGF